MQIAPGAFETAIRNRSFRLAVFDVEMRQWTDQWTLDAPIALETAISTFADLDVCHRPDGGLWLPLHEEESAELSGEVLIVDDAANPTTVSFYDFSRREPVQLPIDECRTLYPAWRVRFWTGDEEPPSPPGFVTAHPSSETPFPASGAISGGDGDADAWLDRVRSALVAGREREREDYRTTSDRESTPDDALTGLVPAGLAVDDYGQQILKLRLPVDHAAASVEDADIDQGDDVLVDGPDAAGLPVEAAVLDYDDETVSLGVYWDTASGPEAETTLTDDTRTDFLIRPLVRTRRLRAVESSLEHLSRTDRAKQVYAGTATLRFADAPDPPVDIELDRYQRRAVSRALAAEDCCVVHAPPWTGAGRVIGGIVRGCLETNRTVGLFAPTSHAIDTALGELVGKDGLLPDLKTYARVDDGTSPTTPHAADLVGVPLDLDRSVDITVDVGILDQAGRCDVATAARAFAVADRLVLVGDPHQLPPREPLVPADADLPPSIFDHLATAYDGDLRQRLRCQYAMNQGIAMYPNHAWYDGELIHGSANRRWAIDGLPPLAVVDVDGDVRRTPTGSWFSDAECDRIVTELQRVLDRSVEPADIGVVTPASAQIGKVRAAIRDAIPEAAEEIVVDRPANVSCIGRDVIIVSLLEGADREEEQWTKSRLNVALTRARKRLVLVGNWTSARESGPKRPVAALAAFLADRGLLPT